MLILNNRSGFITSHLSRMTADEMDVFVLRKEVNLGSIFDTTGFRAQCCYLDFITVNAPKPLRINKCVVKSGKVC